MKSNEDILTKDKGKLHLHKPSTYYYTFGPHRPALRVTPGDSIVTTTADAANRNERGNPLPRSVRHHSDSTQFKETNPLSGPFYVRGAEPGDTLVVSIRKIELTRDFVVSSASYDRGALEWGIASGLSISPPSLDIPSRDYRWKIDVQQSTANITLPNSNRSVSIRLNPHIGCLGVSPENGEVLSSLISGRFGGNLDCVETTADVTVFLPVFVKGALLFVGDVHAAQGDGEISSAGLDITARVTLDLSLEKSRLIRWPRIESKSFIMVVASAYPLSEAFRLAHTELIGWMCEQYRFDALDAMYLSAQVSTTRIGKVVGSSHAVTAKFPKEYLQ